MTLNDAPDHARVGSASLDQGSAESLTVQGATSREVWSLAARVGITSWELAPQAGSLEDAYLALTRESLDFQDTYGPLTPGRTSGPADQNEDLAS